MKRESRARTNYWIVILCVCFFVNCYNPFAPELTDSLMSSDMVVTNQSTPEEVLQNFKIAYAIKDSLLYSDVLDSSFLFIYFDPDEGSSGRIMSWERDADLHATGHLFRHFQMLELIWNTTYYSFNQEHTAEMSKGFNLLLSGPQSTYSLSGKALFSFRRGHDEKWRITQWKDETDI